MSYGKSFNLAQLHTGKPVVIYGAQAVAYTTYKAITKLTGCTVKNFIVSSREGQPDELDGIAVIELKEYAKNNDDMILVATPEDIQGSIAGLLEERGIDNYFFIKSNEFGILQKGLYQEKSYIADNDELAVEVLQAVHEKDRKLSGDYENPSWIVPIQVGVADSQKVIADIRDNTGDNISTRNKNYSELTALYWAWKNSDADIKGICHYRRVPDIQLSDLLALGVGSADVFLTYPLMYYPDISMHHKRYINDKDWFVVENALKEYAPEYYKVLDECMKQQLFINYNILVARKEIFDSYCEWLFPLLFKIGENTVPPESERQDRYMGYIGETLCTLYFMKNNSIKTRYCSCLMRT